MAQPVPFASPTRPDGQGFADIDRNLKALRAVESSWSLPAMPDMVKLDIAAMSGLDPSGISDFAFGLDADVTDTLTAPQRLQIVDLGPANIELTSGTGIAPAPAPVEQDEFGGIPDMRQFLRATAGMAAPQDVEGSASVLAFKERAIRKGYLDADDVTMDERWDPAYNGVIWQMSSDDFARRKSGDSPALGSSIGEISDFFYDWLSPTGLANAAVDLGFWWDKDQIQKEWDRWSPGGVGDSLKKFIGIGRDESIGDLRDLWKMFGPVDDIVMPILNMALLATGVGEVYHFSRAVMIAGRTAAPAYRGLRAWQVAEGASKWELAADAGLDAGRVARALGGSADRAADLARISRPGLLGGRLPGAAGDTMAGWRNLRGVMVAKKGVQQTMRVGFASRLQHRLGYEGVGLEEILPGAPERFEELTNNPFVWVMAEAMFTPYNILEPGTLGKPFGFVKNFSKVGQHSYYADEAADAVRTWIMRGGDEVAEAGMDATQKQAHRAEQAKLWQKEVRQDGATKALARRLTDGNEENLGGYMLWVATMAAIEAESATLSLASKGLRPEYIRNAIKYDHSYVQRRSGLVAQIRYIDPDDPHGFLWYKALSRSKTEEGAVKRFDRYVEAYERSDDNVARRFVDNAIAKHNEQRLQVWGEVMGAHMQPGMLGEAMAAHLSRFGKWDEFVESTDEVMAAFNRGDLESAGWSKVVSPETGVPVGAKRGRVKPQKSWFDEAEDRTWLADFQDIMEDPDWLEFNQTINHWNGMFDAAARSFPKHGRFTVAKPGTILYGDKATELSVVSYLQRVQETARGLRKTTGEAKVFRRVVGEADAAGGFERITEAQLGQIMAGMNDENVIRHGGALLSADDMRYMRRIQRYVRKQQLTRETDPARLTSMGQEMAEEAHAPWLSEVDAHIGKRLEEINRSGRWVEDYGIDSTLPLVEKVKALRRQLPFTAAEVDLDSIPKALADHLQANGYRLVHGTEFAAPADLMGLEVSIADLVDKTKYINRVGVVPGRMIAGGVEGFKKVVRGVGRGVQRFEPEYITAVYRSQLRTALHTSMMRYQPATGAAARNYEQRSSVDLEKIVDILQKVARELGDEGVETWRKSRDTTFVNRAWANVRSAFTPAAPADLVRANQVWKKAVPKLREYSKADGLELTDQELVLIHDALKKSRVVGRTIRGSLINTKDKIQSKPQMTTALRLLGRTAVAQRSDLSLLQKGATKFGAFTTRGASTITGGAVGTGGYLYWSDKEFMKGSVKDQLGHLSVAMSAALAGRMAGGAAVNKVLKGTGITKGAAQKGMKLWFGDDPKHWSRTRRAFQRLSSPGVSARQLDASVAYRHWAYMADASQSIRDFFRFTLSPVFDASRYTEGMVLAQVGGVPEAIQAAGGLRYNMSPSKWRSLRARELAGGKGNKVTRVHKEDAAKEWNTIVDEFSTIGKKRADFDFDALEAGTARFRQIGVLGFNTTEWMASMYGDLTRIHKMDPLKAYETARSAFTYGTKPRSAVEMSVNAVFFPFSFMKKTAGHMAKFLSEDWSRAVMMHDAIRTYELVGDHIDLDELWRKHAPFLEKFQRLNLFAYGVTPGEFGGADRPLIDFWNSTPMAAGTTDQAANYALLGMHNTPILNLFVPQGLSVKSEEEMVNADRLMRRVAPLMNDITAILEDMEAQGHVFFGGHGITKEAEATVGFELVRQFKYELDLEMRFAGFPNGIEDIRKKAAADYQTRLTEFRSETLESYSGYKEAYYDDVIYNSITRDAESARLQREYEGWVEANPQAGFGYPPAEESELRVGYLLDYENKLLRQFGDYDAVPLDRVKLFLDLAGSWAGDSDTVRIQWRVYFRRRWGTIETVRD